jgi:hypothetical protein
MTWATPTSFRIMHLAPFVLGVLKTVAADWINFDTKGVIGVTGNVQPFGTALTNVLETPLYSTVSINNAGVAYTATSTSLVYDGATAPWRRVPYYLKATTGEIIEVLADSGWNTTAGTLTVRRGVLGSTAAAGVGSGVGITAGGVQDNAMLSVMNSLVLGATSGFVIMSGFELPSDPGAGVFRTSV